MILNYRMFLVFTATLKLRRMENLFCFAAYIILDGLMSQILAEIMKMKLLVLTIVSEGLTNTVFISRDKVGDHRGSAC